MQESVAPPEMIGEAPTFLDALSHASAAAGLDRSILVIGERGSGKELIAGRIHFLSARWEGPYVKVNCAALSDALLDSELFGHEAGAFTGAQKRHVGRFERAAGGTLFLDEIASASLRVQEKLLRIIEYGEFERVGGDATLNVDVRVVAAANVNLPAMARAGTFRADLLDRLAFDVVAAPPLRERAEDIPLLAGHFASRFAQEIRAAYPGFAPSAMAALRAHPWPGNVRELKNAAERSTYRWLAAERDGPIGEAVIDPFPTLAEEPAHADAPPPLQASSASSASRVDLKETVAAYEAGLVLNALSACGGNRRRAAERLSLSYDQLRGLVRKHGLDANAANRSTSPA
ncbi:MAG: phage shock protein operon transcriptional activator [Parvularculaceae bacterium]